MSSSASRPYDVVTKVLVESRPGDWVRWLGLPGTRATVIDADLASVPAESDRVIRVTGTSPYLLHIEFQTYYDRALLLRLLRYSVLLWEKHGTPVLTTLVILKRRAGPKTLTGELQLFGPASDSYIHFGYRVIRLWELSANDLLNGDLGLVPLAPLANVTERGVPRLLRRMNERFRLEAAPAEAAELLQASSVLMGIRFDKEAIARILKGIDPMIQSSWYELMEDKRQEGLAEGREEGRSAEARRMLLLLGRRRLGEPGEATLAGLEAASAEQLEALAPILLEVESWDELLAALKPSLPR